MAVTTIRTNAPVGYRAPHDGPPTARGLTMLMQTLLDPMHRLVPEGTGSRRAWRPWGEMTSSRLGYELCIPLPGIERDEICVDVDDVVLNVSGEHHDAPDPLRSGPFAYRAELPDDVDVDRLTARLADGVLSIFAPRGAAPVLPRLGRMLPRPVRVA